MKKRILLEIVFLVSLLFVSISKTNSSVVVVPQKTGDYTVDYFKSVGALTATWDGSIQDGTGNLVGDGSWILTAKHVLCKGGFGDIANPDKESIYFHLGDKSHRVIKIYPHPNSDIALLKIEKIAGEPFALYTTDDLIGKEFYGAGFGRKEVQITDNGIEWDANHWGTKRVFKNRIDYISYQVLTDDFKTAKNYCLHFSYSLSEPHTISFLDGAIPGEGMSGPGDSGGGIFINVNGKMFLAGIQIQIDINKKPYRGIFAETNSIKEWISSVLKEGNNEPSKTDGR